MRSCNEIEISVDRGVYEPAEDSMLMIEALEVGGGDVVLEVGCGSGIIALNCAKAGAKVTATDVSTEAIDCTRKNAERNGLKVRLIRSDLLGTVEGEFDIIVFNPPYLPKGEGDDQRWTGGVTGLETTLAFLRECRRHLSPGGGIYTIVSSLAGAKGFETAAEEMGYDHEVVLRRKSFFEELSVYRLRSMAAER
jgi:release factor glutamine methyltransferase